ncbi:PH domain-containing protein [Prochlorococcus marinus]|uniref:PH domain-containing protein n=1 Tax=Prochlorococcus marinus TaxID=1219 RepID=UPI0022B47BF3|nr:PH domain-containing protein [Prochlorococcus marinus]
MKNGPNEDIFYEGGPANGDLIINLMAGITLIGLPFTFGALVRALWVRYKITTRRISVTGGWLGRDKTQVVYSQISEIRAIPRGLGSYGDMVLVLKDGARLEMRSLPNFRETESYILQKIENSPTNKLVKDVQGFSN